MPRLSKVGAAALAAFGWTSGSAVTADFLVIAGGAGGGNDVAGGGGAGGYRCSVTGEFSGGGASAEGKLSLVPTQSYTVTVGGGGAGAVDNTGNGTNGTNSVFSTITSTGGGGGGSNTGNPANNGGSGGGAGGNTTGGTGTANQGFAGGSSSAGDRPGGGGGAGAVGGAGSSGTIGNGGAGVSSSIDGTSTGRAGGGAGGYSNVLATGGTATDGGGGSSSTVGLDGTANKGGGGGGGGQNGTRDGGKGGSGIVIISYVGAQQFGGGVVTSSGGNTIHTFTTSGTLSPLNSLTASSLVVAGGGGASWAGGGGAGGYRTGSGITIDTNSIYLVTVGAGGAQAVSGVGNNGSDSVFNAITSAGGGYGRYNVSAVSAGSGGSGGGIGGQAGTQTAGSGNTPSTSPSQGNNGGTGSGSGGGGGGGASAVGQSIASTTGGNGGAGSANPITGSTTGELSGGIYYLAGGGGGGASGAGGTGGAGGGGAGSTTVGTAGTANLGGGGGGGWNNNGGNGGSGVVIISYSGSVQKMAGGTVTVAGGNVIHTFTSSGFLTPIVLTTNSLRFRSSATAYLDRTPPTAGNRRTWTWSSWIKRGQLGAIQVLFGVGNVNTGTSFGGMYFTSTDTLIFYSPTTGGYKETTQVFRDPAAWYHLVVSYDTPNSSVRLYVNGTEITSFSTNTNPSANVDGNVNAAVLHTIGKNAGASDYYIDGYLTEVNFIDGLALTPFSFGTSNGLGVWQPIRYGGSYGTNGFYLPFTGSSTYAASFNGSSQRLLTSTSASLALGTNDFTVEYWVYFNANTVGQIPVTAGDGATSFDPLFGYYDTGDILVLYISSNGTTWGISLTQTIGAVTTGKWYHVAITRSGSTFYTFLNGVQGSTFTSSASIYQSANSFGIGKAQTSNYTNGYISNVRVIIGTCLYTTNFVPSTTPLTAVTNTKLLTLQNATIVDNSTNALTFTNTGSVTTTQTYPFTMLAGQSKDYSPQGNNWTNNNISVLSGSTLDVMTDVPTLTSATASNFATWSPLVLFPNTTYQASMTNANLLMTRSGGGQGGAVTTIGVTNGKFYAEMTVTAVGSSVTKLGVMATNNPPSISASSEYALGDTSAGVAYRSNGARLTGGTTTNSWGDTYTTGNVIGVAFDADTGKVWFSKNGTFQASGDPAAGTNEAATLPTAVPFYFSAGGESGISISLNALYFFPRFFAILLGYFVFNLFFGLLG